MVCVSFFFLFQIQISHFSECEHFRFGLNLKYLLVYLAISLEPTQSIHVCHLFFSLCKGNRYTQHLCYRSLYRRLTDMIFLCYSVNNCLEFIYFVYQIHHGHLNKNLSNGLCDQNAAQFHHFYQQMI